MQAKHEWLASLAAEDDDKGTLTELIEKLEARQR